MKKITNEVKVQHQDKRTMTVHRYLHLIQCMKENMLVNLQQCNFVVFPLICTDEVPYAETSSELFVARTGNQLANILHICNFERIWARSYEISRGT